MGFRVSFACGSRNTKTTGFSSCKPESSVILQLPNLFLPFGLSEPNPEKGINKYSLPISLGGPNPKPIERELLTKLEAFDEWLAEYASKNAQQFFGVAKKSVEVCRELMNPTVKLDKNPENAAKYGPRVAPSVQHTEDGGFYNTECRDVDNTVMRVTDIKRQSSGYVQIELTSLYSVGGKAFGATWVVRAVRITAHAAHAAPPIDVDMYGDCPNFEAALLALPIPEPKTTIQEYEEEEEGGDEEEETKTPAKRERADEEPEVPPAPQKKKATKAAKK